MVNPASILGNSTAIIAARKVMEIIEDTIAKFLGTKVPSRSDWLIAKKLVLMSDR